MLNITIGCNSYCGSNRVINLFKNITKAVDFDKYIITRVLIDDGSTNKESELLKNLCETYYFGYIRNEINMGIPYCWNTICNINDKADIVFIFNDDIELVNSNWLKCAVYFIENNDNIGTVGFPNIRTYDYVLTDYFLKPQKVMYSNGSCFAINMEAYKKTNGFWNDLFSFFEEIDFGFQLSTINYECFQIPFPFVFHRQGQTFDENNNLLYRKYSDYLDINEYIYHNKNSKYLKDLFINKTIDNDYVNRMNYARTMFFKKWKNLGLLNEEKIDDIEFNVDKFLIKNSRIIKYLNFNKILQKVDEMEDII